MLTSSFQARLQSAIDHFLNATCWLTPRWFNKPKFHLLLHLPDHVRRFGPAVLFATEGFEAYNAVIRSYSIHSNRHAPSRDIARGMARGNRLRHLLSGGHFCIADYGDEEQSLPEDEKLICPWLRRQPCTDSSRWVTAAPAALRLLEEQNFGHKILGLELTVGDKDDIEIGESSSHL